MKKILFSIITLIFFTGCVHQPKKINNLKFPQVEIQSNKIENFKDNLVFEMSQLGFNIVSSSKYDLDFRKKYAPGEDGFARAILQSADGSTIDSKGVDFYILPSDEITIIRGKPYLYKTFTMKSPEKYDMSDNNNFFNKVQKILNTVKDKTLGIKK